MPDKNRPDPSSATRILPGRFGSKENPRPAPRAATPVALSGSSPAPDPKRGMADSRTSLSHRPPAHVEVSAELIEFNPETNGVRVRINACGRREFEFYLHELPSRVQWAIAMSRRFYRVAVDLKAETKGELDAMDWSVVEDQRERRGLRGT